MMKEFINALKKHLVDKKDEYLFHSSMNGSTETGFYSSDDFDMDELLKQIDEFSETFKEVKL